MEYEKDSLILHKNTPSTQRLLRERGIIIDDESMSDAINRVLVALLSMDEKLEETVDEAFCSSAVKFVYDGIIVFGTPILSNAGREGRITGACTVLPLGLLDMSKFKENSEKFLGSAMGTGYDLSSLDKPSLEVIHMNNIIVEIDKALTANNQRPAACMASLRADHPDILNFIRVKRDTDPHNWRFNLSVFVTEELFARAIGGENWDLIDNEGRVVSSLPALSLIEEIAENAHYCGEPGILFKDRFEKDNPTPQWEYQSTAPCAEVALAPGEVCQFAYINLTSLFVEDEFGTREFDFDTLRKAVGVTTRLLDNSVQITIANYTDDATIIEAKRRVGVGIMGLAGLLMNLDIPYDSAQAIWLSSRISEIIDFSSKEQSVQLSKKRGCFPLFHESRYTDENWLRRKNKYKTGVIKDEEWESLYTDITRYGLRNASTSAFPPTGTSSRIMGATSSFEPYLNLSVQGVDSDDPSNHVLAIPAPILNAIMRSNKQADPSIELPTTNIFDSQTELHAFADNNPLFHTAQQISVEAHLAIVSAFQRFADESGSKTVNLPSHSTTEDVLGAIFLAYNMGLKGLTVFRDGSLNIRG